MTDSSPQVTDQGVTEQGVTDQGVRKKALRLEMLARRDAVTSRERVRAAMTIAVRPVPVAIAPGIIGAGFSPLKGGIDPIPLLPPLADPGGQLAPPAPPPRG